MIAAVIHAVKRRRVRLAGAAVTVALTFALFACSPGSSSSPAPSPLLNPDPTALAAPAPETFRVAFETSKGRFVVEARRAWAPRGVDRFHYLVRHGYYDGARFFRVLDGFMAQFGFHGDPKVTAVWNELRIPDDPVTQSNRRGLMTFATGGPNTRTTQLFVNYGDNARLDGMGFTPFGEVVEGMAVVDSLYSGYGEGAPQGQGPDQFRIATEGERYLTREFPKLDYVKTARIEPGATRSGQ